MAGQDEHTYGFNKADASSLLEGIGSRDGEYREGVVRGQGSTASLKLFLTPGGGIAARSSTTVSSATCTEYKIVGTTLTTNTNTQSVYNPWPVAIPASYYITAIKESVSGFWIAQFPGIVNVRWVDPDLEQTLDGTNYANIDTAEAC